MDPVSLALGIIPVVVQAYQFIETAYDFYLKVKEFPVAFQELHVGLQIERYRLDLWANHMLSEEQQEQLKDSPGDIKLWKLIHAIFEKILAAFEEGDQTMSVYGEQSKATPKEALAEWETVETLSITVKSNSKFGVSSLARTAKFVLRDKVKLETLILKLCHWNDSLDKLTSRWDQEASRRRLRVYCATKHLAELQYVQQAAALFAHHDIETMASTKSLIERGYEQENLFRELASSPEPPVKSLSNYLLEYEDFNWQGIPYRTEQKRAIATYKRKSVIVDWRSCRDDAWRRKHPEAFRMRTENLAKILNQDLKSFNLSVLHCVGYLDQSANVTGYAFRLPEGTPASQRPLALYEILVKARKPQDIPDLGERFRLAKALVSTLFEIHNLGWMHKSISPRNILFWPKPGTDDQWDFTKPYLVGFDIARLNRPDEMSEKPLSDVEDDLYRHPDYKGDNAKSFIPSYDMYSMGIVLFEIGMWRTVASQSRHSYSSRPSTTQRPPFASNPSDPSHPCFIDTVVMGGSVMDLKRFMGIKYRDAVKACLNKQLDALCEGSDGYMPDQMAVYLEAVQDQILDPIATCNA